MAAATATATATAAVSTGDRRRGAGVLLGFLRSRYPLE
ncbi:hypothetical protein ACP4OV_004683 [Aristida adscensionis]